ncbi:MAG: hypothetical protein GDA43_25525 [Hormoscilla sp. SP5CHS1]|nr:hypothetical protein [Hormoscilla sp. SP5CHS1]
MSLDIYQRISSHTCQVTQVAVIDTYPTTAIGLTDVIFTEIIISSSQGNFAVSRSGNASQIQFCIQF